MFKKISLLLALCTIGFGSSAQSQEINAWKHCGIGAMIFDDNETAAIISNVIWDLGTTALSSKISSQENCEGTVAQTAMFINESYDKLAEETVTGKGEHLTAMMDIMQCSSSSQGDFVKAVRADFSEAYAKKETASFDRTARAEQYFNIVNKQLSTNFSAKCSVI